MLYNVVLVSAIQQRNSQKYTNVPSLLKLASTPYFIPALYAFTEHWVELPVLHSSFPLAIYFTYGKFDSGQCYSLNASHPLLPLQCPQVCSLCLCLYSSPANRFISTILLDSMCAKSLQSCPTHVRLM